MSKTECRDWQSLRLLSGLIFAGVVVCCDAGVQQREAHGTVAQASTGFNTSAVSTTQNGAAAPAPGSFAPIARNITPAVVSIESEFSQETASRMQGMPPGMAPRGRPRTTGSGFLVTPDGYILTNNHVVANAQKVVVGLNDRRIIPARIIGNDPSTDVALIKIDGGTFPVIPLGDDESVQVGDQVLAVGNPLGLNFTVTSGIISAKGRSGSLAGLFESSYAVVDFLQTDAAVNPGNSGGPLVDMHGQAIGINSAIASPTGVYAGYGFAVPITIARIVMDELRKHGRVRRAILGVSIQDVGPADAQAAGLKEIRGVLVAGFSGSNSPAQRAGLQAGDVIVAVDGRSVDRVSDMQRLIFGYEPGRRVTLTVQRFGAQRTIDLTLGEAPGEQVATGDAERPGTTRRQLGISAAPLTPELSRQLELPDNVRSGVVVADVDPSGPAAERLTQGDVITASLGAGGRQRPIRGVDDLREVIAQASGGIVSLMVYSPQARATRVVNLQLAQ
jgi:serine protease Do